MRRYFIPAIVLLISSAHPAQAGFQSAAEAREWCKKKTQNYLSDQGLSPYNWTASTHLQDMRYITEGVWRVDTDDIKVECKSKKDGKRVSGKFKVLNLDIVATQRRAGR